MKRLSLLLLPALFQFMSCTENTGKNKTETAEISLSGSWKLISAKTITGKDTVSSYPVDGQEMIKIFNGRDFAFFKHDLKRGKGPGAVFESGAGTYQLAGEDYQEHLAYCSYRDWENRDFKFKLTLKNDTLIQKGIEKIDSLNVNHEIVETYTKIHH